MKQLLKKMVATKIMKHSLTISLLLLAIAMLGICFMTFTEKPMTASAEDGTVAVSGSAITAISVTSPSAGDNLKKLSTQTVAWTYTAADTEVEAVTGAAIKVELIKSGTAVETINSSIALTTAGANITGSISWTPTSGLAAGSGYQIKISSVNYPGVYAVSGEFTILNSYSGQLLTQYTGAVPNYPEIAQDVNVTGYSVSIARPIALGQTVSGRLEPSYTMADVYLPHNGDLYSLVLDEDTPFMITGNASKPVYCTVFLYGMNEDGDFVERGFVILGTEGMELEEGWTGITKVDYGLSLAQSTTHCFTLKELGIVSGMVYLRVTGYNVNYTLTITSPVAGAAVNLLDAASSDTLKTVVSGEDGTWDLSYAADGQYQISPGKEGYTFAPDKVEVSDTTTDIKIAAPVTAPEITSFTLDQTEFSFGDTVTARIQTNGAADGTPVSVNLLLPQGGSFQVGYAELILAFTGYISDNEVIIPITIPASKTIEFYYYGDLDMTHGDSFDFTTPPGEYQLRAMIEGSAIPMSKAVTLNSSTTLQQIHATADSCYTLEKQMDFVRVHVTTENVADATPVLASLTDDKGTEFYLSIRSDTDQTISGNRAELCFYVPGSLEAGNYYIQVETDTTKHLVTQIPYTIYPNDMSITSVKVAGQLGESEIDTQNHTVTVHMPYGSDISALKPTIEFHGEGISLGSSELTLTGGAAAPTVSGYTVNFENAVNNTVNYTIITKESDATSVTTSQTWSITVDTPQTTFTSFGFSGLDCSTDMNEAEHSITVTLPDGTLLSELTAEYALTNGAFTTVDGVLQESGVTVNNYQKQVVYTVSDASGYTADWTITVKCNTYQFNLSQGTITWEGGLHASITVAPSGGALHSGEETVLFTLLKAGQKLDTVTGTQDILKEDTVEAYFNVNNSDASYSVLVTVIDSTDAGSTELAAAVTLK